MLAISFSDKTTIDPAGIVAALPRVFASGHADADGKTLRFVLTAPVKLHVSQLGARAVVDIADPGFSGAMPDLAAPAKPVVKPLDVASLPEIKLRTGAYAKFTRLVFDWPKDVSYQVFPGAGKMTVKFNTPVRADVSALARFAPPWVKNATWRIDGQSTIFEFETDSDSGYHDFKDGNHVVLDILAPKTDGAAYTPPGTAKPAITKIGGTAMTAATPATKSGASAAQAQAIAQVSDRLAADKAKPAAKPVEAKPDAKAQTKVADAKPAAPPPAPPPAAPAPPPPAQAAAAPAVIPVAGGQAHP